MSYAVRWQLFAIHPVSLSNMGIGDLPKGYIARVQRSLTEGTGQEYLVDLDPKTGDLFHGETTSWYEELTAMEAMSRACPELIWAVRGMGEDHKEWVTYAYRGRHHRFDRPPWTPPPPDMSYLPVVEEMRIPSDPLNEVEALELALDSIPHSPACAARSTREDGRPSFILSTKCNCNRGLIEKALAAAREKSPRS